MRQSMGHVAWASSSAMLVAAIERTACLSVMEGELSITQRKSTFTARASRAPSSSASESAATTRAPVDLVMDFIFLPSCCREAPRAPASDSPHEQGGCHRKSGAQRDANARHGSQRRMIGCGVHARRARRICGAMAAR